MIVYNLSLTNWMGVFDGATGALGPGVRWEGGSLQVSGVSVVDQPLSNAVVVLGESGVHVRWEPAEQTEFLMGFAWALPLVGLLGAYWVVRRALGMDGLSGG